MRKLRSRARNYFIAEKLRVVGLPFYFISNSGFQLDLVKTSSFPLHEEEHFNEHVSNKYAIK